MTKRKLTVVEAEAGKQCPQVKIKKADYLYWPILVITPKAVTPNMLSAARLMIALPLILIMYLHFGKIAAAIFIAAAIMDGLDGALARWRSQTSQFGAILDPTADKAVNFAVFIGFLFNVNSDIYTKLIAAIIIIDSLLFSVAFGKYLVKDYLPHLSPEHWLRDWITPDDIMQAIEVKKTGANSFGKTKMVIQVIVLSALLLFDPRTSLKLHKIFSFLPKVTLLELSYPLLIICIIFGLLSLYGHLKVVRFKR